MATDVHVHTGYCNGNSSAPIYCYVGYTTSQDISNNRSTISCYWWISVPSGWTIGPWSDVAGSYVGTTGHTFNGAIANIGAGSHIISDTKSFNVNHNADGTGATTIYWKWGVNSSWGRVQKPSGSFNITLPTIPRQANITSAPDFNDTQNPTIQYTNSAGNSVTSLQARIENSAGNEAYVEYRDIAKTGSSYTFNLTDAERNVLRSKCPNSNTLTVKFVVKTVIGGNTFWSTVNKTMTIVNGNPTFPASSITYADTNSTVTAITQNNQNIVQNQSNLKVTVADATANKYATITKYEITFNGVTRTINGASGGTVDFGTVNLSMDEDVTVKVTDSRGNTTTRTKEITILEWSIPSAVISCKRLNNYEDDTNLKADVTISDVDSKNAILELKYRYRKQGTSTWSSYTSFSDGVQTTFQIDKDYIYDVQVVVRDKFYTRTYDLIVIKGVAILFIDVALLSVGINCLPTVANSLEVNGYDFMSLYPVGCIMYTTVNTNPGTSVPGTWTLLTSGNLITGLNQTIYAWTRTG